MAYSGAQHEPEALKQSQSAGAYTTATSEVAPGMRSAESNHYGTGSKDAAALSGGSVASGFSAIEAAADEGIVLELKKLKVLGRGQFGVVSEGMIIRCE